MTEQEKAALFKWLQKEIALIQSAQDEIPFGLDNDGENTLKVFNIALAALTTPPAPAIPDGWRLVPVVPRMEQLILGRKSINGTGKMSHLMHQRLSDIYRAMLAAAPKPGASDGN